MSFELEEWELDDMPSNPVKGLIKLPILLSQCSALLVEARADEGRHKQKLSHWKAVTYQHILAHAPKSPEWKVRAEVEAMPECRSLKLQLIEAQEEVAQLESVLEALKLKAQVLEIIGKLSNDNS